MQETIDQLGKIQDILFGEFKIKTEDSLKKIELSLNEQIDQLRAEFKSNNAAVNDTISKLESDFEQQLTSSLNGLDGELSHQIAETNKSFEQYTQKTDAELVSLEQEIKVQLDSISTSLDDGKLSRQQMADLLKAMASQIEE